MAGVDIVAFAQSYPFDCPEHAFAFINGKVQSSGRLFRRMGHPVLACGSNSSPIQLARKFGESHQPILVEPVEIADWAIVYSRHFTGYGSIPATLIPRSGARTAAHLIWLNDRDLLKMHATELLGVNYDYVTSDQIIAWDASGRSLEVAGYYRSRRGTLAMRGQPLRLAELGSADSGLRALSQRALLNLVRKKLAPDQNLYGFVRRIVMDASYRQEQSQALWTLAKA